MDKANRLFIDLFFYVIWFSQNVMAWSIHPFATVPVPNSKP